MALNLGSDDISKITNIINKSLKNNIEVLHTGLVYELGKGIARDTPIDSGKATANWTVSYGSPDIKDKKVYDKSPSAAPTVKKIDGALGAYSTGSDIYLSNGVREDVDQHELGGGYIIQLDEGKSPQARNGMIDKNIVQSKNILDRLSK